MPSTGILNYLSGNSINLGSLDTIDELKITLSKFKLNYLLDYVDINDIYFDTMPSEQRNMISQICYSKSIYSVINYESSTVRKRMDGEGIRFEDPSDGYISIIHGLLRKGLVEIDPIELALGKYHVIATNFIYMTLIRSFDKYYNIIGKTEKDLARIKYACACVTASKMFKITDDPNRFAEPVVSLDFKRVDPSYYIVDDAPSTYAKVAEYLSNSKVMPNLNVGNLAEAFIRHLGNRSLVILESGVDFIIDTLLSKGVSKLIPRNLYKLVGERNYQIISQYIAASFNSAKKVEHDIPTYMKPKELPKEGEYEPDPIEIPQQEPQQPQPIDIKIYNQMPPYPQNNQNNNYTQNTQNYPQQTNNYQQNQNGYNSYNQDNSSSNRGYPQHYYNRNYPNKNNDQTNTSSNGGIFNNLRGISSFRRKNNDQNDNSGITKID